MTDTDFKQLETVMTESVKAFNQFKSTNVRQRAELMRSIAAGIESLGDELIDTAHQETNLPKPRLINEKGRTVFQWRAYAEAIETGVVLDLRIDTPLIENATAKADIRKSMTSVGPVAVFGASNFPFAFSTAGGDSASAIAAGCSVVVKEHPAHPKTSQIMTKAIQKAISESGFPEELFQQVAGGVEVGAALVKHPSIKAVGFTGSFGAGKSLFDLANQRPEPIPVFAEMGSINPLFLMPEKLNNYNPDLASQYAGSLTLGTGQFCTNPGVLVAIKGGNLQRFIEDAKNEIKKKPAETMLHQGIASHYKSNSLKMVDHPDITVIGKGDEGNENTGQAILSYTTGKQFIKNKDFCAEVFGPFGLIVECDDINEMMAIAEGLEGQLTTTLLTEESELDEYKELVSILKEKCGRMIFNQFPTGVEVCFSMQHGGPFPATTDSRFTSVGADAIKRFLRPVSYQNWPDSQLPDELKNSNPLQLVRTINGLITKNSISK